MINKKNDLVIKNYCSYDDIENFKQLSKDFKVNIPISNPEILDIIKDNVFIDIVEYKVVPCPKGKSLEGVYLTSNMLIIYLDINTKFQYISLVDKCSVHAISSIEPCIVSIPIDDYSLSNLGININTFVEDVFYSIENSRKIYVNVAFLVTVE